VSGTDGRSSGVPVAAVVAAASCGRPPGSGMTDERAAEGIEGTRGLPLPLLYRPAPRPAASFWSTTVDHRGRLGVLAPLRELGWVTGSTVSFQLVDGIVVVAAAAGGCRIGHSGHLRLPAVLCRRCCLHPGSRVLVIARRSPDQLEIHPPASVEAMLHARSRTCP